MAPLILTMILGALAGVLSLDAASGEAVDAAFAGASIALALASAVFAGLRLDKEDD